MEKYKLQVLLNDDMYEWVKKQSECYALSMSAFTNMVLAQYKQSQEAIKQMQTLPGMIEELKKLQSSLNSEAVSK